MTIKYTKKECNASIYPIITIYIFGYTLDDLLYMAVTVNRDVINSMSKEKLHVKRFFIEHLTHQSHIIQVRACLKTGCYLEAEEEIDTIFDHQELKYQKITFNTPPIVHAGSTIR